MPRYYFHIRSPSMDRSDADGTWLRDDSAAYARRLIGELKTLSAYDRPELIMIITDETGRHVSTVPFSA